MRRLCLICWHLERRNLRACSRSFKDEGASMRTSADARLADQSREWSQHKQHSKRFEPGANWEGRSRAGRSTGSEPNRERCIYTKSSMGCRSCLKNSWGATGVWKPGPTIGIHIWGSCRSWTRSHRVPEKSRAWTVLSCYNDSLTPSRPRHPMDCVCGLPPTRATNQRAPNFNPAF